MNKILKVNNFGIYYKTGETNLITNLEDDAHKIDQLRDFNQFDEDGRSLKQVEDYLIKPIRLEVKLTQNDPETALEAQTALTALFVSLEEFGITLQKG